MKEIKIGIVGLGWAAGAHIHAFHQIPGVRVVAVCSRRKLDSDQLQKEYGRPMRVYHRLSEMLKDPEISIVDICTEPELHARQAVASARAGKHVILEKPLALKLQDALAISQAVKKAKVKATVCFEVRFTQQFQLLRSIIDRGLIGKVHYAECDYYHGIGPWYKQYRWNVTRRNGGSSLLSAGCHALDALLMLLDGKVVEVTSRAIGSKNKDFMKYEYPTTTLSMLKFDSGAIAKVVSCIDCIQPYYFHVHLVGSEGSVLDNKLHTTKLKGLKKEWATLPTALVDSGDVSDHPYEAQFRDFIDAVRDNRPVAVGDLETALETHKVVFAADESARTGKTLRLK